MLNYSIKEITDAIKGTRGSITKIAENLHCNWHTAKKYINSYDETQEALQDEIEKNIDIAENVVLNEIDKNDVQTAKWYLQTIGKNRGYSEKLNLEHSGSVKQEVEESILDEKIDKLLKLRELEKNQEVTKHLKE
jgi:hypothetical protein